MKFLDRFFRQKEEKKIDEPDKIFDIESATGFLQKKYDDNFQALNAETSEAHGKIIISLGILEESLSKFEKANFEQPDDTFYVRTIISHRKSFLNKMEIMISELSKPLDSDPESMRKYQTSSLSAVKDTDAHVIKEYSIMNDTFPDILKKVLKDFRSVFNATQEFNDRFLKNQDLLKPTTDAMGILDSLKENMRDLEKNKTEADDNGKKLLDLKKKLEAEEESLKSLKLGKDWSEFNRSLEVKRDLESQISEIRSDISENFSKVEKPLKKFQHLVQSGAEEINDKKMLADYINSPVDALIAAEDFSFINTILEKVKHGILSDSIVLKDKNKTLSEIEWIINRNVFKELVSKYNSLLGEMRKLQNTIENQNVSERKKGIEVGIEQFKKDIQSTDAEIERSQKKIEKLKASVTETKKELEDNLTKLIGVKATFAIN